MEFGMIVLLLILALLGYLELTKWKKQVKALQRRLDALCQATGNPQLAAYWIDDAAKEVILHLKNTGKEVEAIQKLREVTAMDLVQAKQYLDTL